MIDIENLIPINIGLLGHIDHGKTAIARVLSEIISTAGLDKHRQARERGISIDIGITSFVLDDKYLITLVDTPGHADLIRSVVAASNIIDGAIVVIAADEGPKIQTGEHLLILESFNVKDIVIALNKIDLISKDKLESRINQIKVLLKGSSFSNASIVPVSVKSKIGFDNLKNELIRIVKIPKRNYTDPFKMPIDHAFQIKGAGTIITGTINRGTVKEGDIIEIMPTKHKRKVKSIQIFRKDQKKAVAGQRTGISIIKIPPNEIFRGYYACTPGSLSISDKLIINGKINQLFEKGIQPKLQIHLTVGMPTTSGIIYPFKISNGKNILIENVLKGINFFAYIQMNERISVEVGMPLLISRLDIDPTKLRIVASGKVESIPSETPKFFRIRIKEGIIRNLDRKEGVIVEGLSDNKIGARTFIDKFIQTENGNEGKIINTFGSKGSVIVQFDNSPMPSEKVYLKKYRSYKI